MGIEKGVIENLKSQIWPKISIAVKFCTDLIGENRLQFWIHPEELTQNKASGESDQVY